MREPSGVPAPAGVLFPELLTTPEPAPPARGRGARLLRVAARVLLWSLIAVGAVRGLMPAPSGPAPTRSARAGSAPASVVAGSARSSPHQQAGAVAAVFLREYLTVGEDTSNKIAGSSVLFKKNRSVRFLPPLLINPTEEMADDI